MKIKQEIEWVVGELPETESLKLVAIELGDRNDTAMASYMASTGLWKFTDGFKAPAKVLAWASMPHFQGFPAEGQKLEFAAYDVQQAILSERIYQDRKWPNHRHSVAEWLLILEKIVGDARRAWVTNSGDEDALHEVRQIVATGIVCMEQCGALKRIGKEPEA